MNPNQTARRTVTRRKQRVDIQKTPAKSYSDELIERFVTQKKPIYYNYMITNIVSMFKKTKYIKHFHIRPGLFGLWVDAEELNETYGKDIQSDCIMWIKNELTEDRLFNLNNWTPYQDPDDYTELFLGYRKMYQYKQYFFQLVLDENCSECKDCDDCKYNNYTIHFELAYYGWKDNQITTLQPLQYFIVPFDNMIPDQCYKIQMK
jgi:hypothetical protein